MERRLVWQECRERTQEKERGRGHVTESLKEFPEAAKELAFLL